MSARKKIIFTHRERCLLIAIIKEFKNELELKKTDNASALMKKQTQEKIAKRYNESTIPNEPATGEQLRRHWQNINTRQKEALTEKRQHRLATEGGGPCPDAAVDPNILGIAPAPLVKIPEAVDSDMQGSQVEELDVAVDQADLETPEDPYFDSQPSSSETQPPPQRSIECYQPKRKEIVNMSARKNTFLSQRLSQDQCRILIDMIKEVKNELKSKETDNASAQIKKQTQERVAKRYNESTIVNEPANGEQLRRHWQNIHTRQKEALTEKRQHRLATEGGGPCPDAAVDPNILGIAPALLVKIPEAVDSDMQGSQVEELEVAVDQADLEAPEDPYFDSQPSSSGTQPPPQSSVECHQPSHEIPQPTLPANEPFSNKKRKLKVQILKSEYLNRERRAAIQHKMEVEFLRRKQELEIRILEEQLREATARADKKSN